MNDYISLIIFIVLGLLIVLGYIKMVIKPPKKDIWSNNGTNGIEKLKKVYTLMIFLSMIAGIYLIYYLVTNPAIKEDTMYIRYTGLIIFLSFSLVWALKPFMLSSLVLFMVPIGVSLILASVCLDNSTLETLDSIAVVACTLLLVQTFIFDFFIWTANYKLFKL